MNLTELDQFHWETHDRIAVIETPAQSRSKIDYDPDREIFHVHHLLSFGLRFPCNFGFFPRTKASDGDPLDVLILMDEPGYPGLVVAIRLLGAIEAEQTEGEKTFRNDRLVSRAIQSSYFGNVNTLDDLNPKLLDELEDFFAVYNRQRGKQFRVLARSGPEEAERLIEDASVKHITVDQPVRKKKRTHGDP